MTTPAIMGFHPPGGAAVGADSIGPMYDAVYGRIFAGSQTAAAVGFRYYDAWPNGVQVFENTLAVLGGFTNNGGPMQFRAGAQQIASAPTGANGAKVSYLRASELSLAGSFGTNDSSFTNNSVHIEGPRRGCCIQGGIGVGTFGVDVTILNALSTSGAINAVAGEVNVPLGTVTENFTEVGSLPDGTGTVAYVMGYTKLGGATQVGFYTATSAALTSIRKIQANEIDAAWSHIDTVYGISIDQTDGNPIVGFLNNTDAPANRGYLCKINKTAGTIIWAIPVGAGVNYDAGMKFNVIKNGRLWYIASAVNTLYAINTIAGTFTTQTISNAALDGLHGDQCSEDVTDSVMWLGSWSEGTTHPNYLGDYMFTKGNHSGSGMIFRYFPNGTPSPAPVYGAPAQSRKRAWTFTLDGHTFYVLDLGQEGTWLYDTTTSEWCRFLTQGFDNWDVVNGTMWGRRIVGNDYLTSDLWEMQPAATKDNGGTLELVRVVTGGLQKRNRIYSSVEALRLTGSIGLVDDAAAAVVSLRFSDDNGQTWSQSFPITLTTNTNQVLEWPSLGSFTAPGRIFEITDTGGLLRIDGADAAMDNYDEDQSSGGDQQGQG